MTLTTARPELARSTRARAAWTKGLLGVDAGLLTLSGFFMFGVTTDPSSIDAATGIYGLYVLTALSTAVAFVLWSYRAHGNLKVLGREGIRHSDQATIWWWIVPIAFLFMPYRVVFETVRGSQANLDDPNWRHHQLDGSAVTWTGLVLGGLFVQGFGNTMVDQALSLSELTTAFAITGFGSLVLASGAIAGIVMVGRVTQAQIRHLDDTTRHLDPASMRSRPSAEVLSAANSLGGREEGAATSKSESSAYCSRCGQRFNADDRFCGGCGAQRL